MTENEGDLGLIHPVLPNQVGYLLSIVLKLCSPDCEQLPNFLKGLNGQLRFGSPPDITESDTLGFMVSDISYLLPICVSDDWSA